MKRCATPSRKRRRQTHSGLLALLVVIPMACVTSAAHERALAERDRLAREAKDLRERVVQVESSNESLSDELDDTLEQLENLRLERQALSQTVASLRESESRLASDLSGKSLALEESQVMLAAASSEVSRLSDTYGSLVSDLESELAAGQIQIEQLREGIRVNMSDDILFASGSAVVDPVGRDVLLKLVEQLGRADYMIEVQGHTDNRPMRGALARRYPSNWDLAAARAARVVRLMQSHGISGDRLSAVSLGSERPIASNETADGRAVNRRIEIRLQPRPGVPEVRTPGVGSKKPPAGEAPHGG